MTTLLPRSIVAGLLFSNAIAYAEPNGMDMEKMMQQAEAAQACFENIDQAQLQALERQGRVMEQGISALCKAGKKSEATSKAMQYSLKLQKDPSFKQIQECAKYMDGIMPMPKPYIPIAEGDSGQSSNVCD